ncbi:MAG TPA: delta-60 repeat domain-containing protein, partial [Polyangiaceae bacterium]|nr:delta-60 repeat domain-containing protein [Polyangiaceae bacterium]
VPLSEDENDRLWGATIDADGNLYAAGVLGSGTDNQMVLVRITPDGELDESFGEDGLAVLNVVEGGATETARAVAVQSDGKIVIAGHAEHDPDAEYPDADLVVARFDADGTLDETFGEDGVAIVDLGPGAENVNDLLWNVDVDDDDRIVLFASKKAADPAP